MQHAGADARHADLMANSEAQTPECVCEVQSVLGEGPLWIARENAVYWVDIKGGALHRLRLGDDEYRRWDMPDMLCWVVERSDGPGFIAGLRNRFVYLQLDPLRIRDIGVPEPDLPDNRLNDATADRRGSIWAGTMDDLERTASGFLYRLAPDGQWATQDGGYIVSNGPVFSPDDDWLYHTDSIRRVIYRFPFDSDGRLGAREEWVRFPEDWGMPDGMATDAGGGIWVAHWGGGRVSRFLPDARLDRVIDLPVTNVTSCCFAGPELDRLFISTAAIGNETEAQAGCLFEVRPGVSGIPVHAYRG